MPLFDTDAGNALSRVVTTLLNEFPGLGNKTISFSGLDHDSGIGFFPTSGATFLQNKESITGYVKQTCLYPFTVIYRAAPVSDSQRIEIKEFLDALGRWIEQETITIDENEYRLESYPDINSSNRKIKSIERTNAAHLGRRYNDAVEDWQISLRLTYTNEYQK